jgi:arginase
VAAALAHPLEEVAGRRRLVYLHIDLDVLDPTEVKANVFAAPGGLSLPEAVEVVLEVGERFEIAAVSLTSYDPDHDQEDRGPRIVTELIEAVLAAAR